MSELWTYFVIDAEMMHIYCDILAGQHFNYISRSARKHLAGFEFCIKTWLINTWKLLRLIWFYFDFIFNFIFNINALVYSQTNLL